MESVSGEKRLRFATLQARLIRLINNKINNGEFSERGFARLVGVSQPQIHNLLKGARKLRPETADLFLAKLELSILDLLTADELTPAFRPASDPFLDYMLSATYGPATPEMPSHHENARALLQIKKAS